MSDNNIEYLMSLCDQENVEYIDKSGKKHKGYVDVFESREDNEGEASICFIDDNGNHAIVTESDIESITVISDREKATA